MAIELTSFFWKASLKVFLWKTITPKEDVKEVLCSRLLKYLIVEGAIYKVTILGKQSLMDFLESELRA